MLTTIPHQGLGPTGAPDNLLLILFIALGVIAVGGAFLVTRRRGSGED